MRSNRETTITEMRRLLVPISLLFLAAPVTTAAEEVHLTPARELTHEQRLRRAEAAGEARQSVAGWGDRLRITYKAGKDIDLDLAPLHRGSDVDPLEMTYTTLPAGEHVAVIDLTASPGWSLLPQEYVLQFASPAGTDRTDILAMEFLPPSIASIGWAAETGLLRREEFLVSTPQIVRGASLAGIPFALLVGMMTAAAAVFFPWLTKRNAGSGAIMAILTIGTLFYGLWFGIDLARFTIGHLREWAANGTIGDFGAAENIGAALRTLPKDSRPPVVYVCSDAGNYIPKAIRYFAYPVPVSSDAKDIPRATHVLVARKLQWTEGEGMLRCGEVSGEATRIKTFADGSILFAAAP